MYRNRFLHVELSAMLAMLLLTCTPRSAWAAPAPSDSLIGLLGALVQGASQAKVRSSWDGVPMDTRSCVDAALSAKNKRIEDLIGAGVKASDQRISGILNFCQALASRSLRDNFPCRTTNDAGQNVETACYEQFASSGNGELRPVDRDAFIRLAASGGKVEIATLELPAAKTARLQAERHARQVAQAEKQRLVQLNAEQERVRAAELARKELGTFRPY